MHAAAGSPTRLAPGEFLTLTLGWAVIGFHSILLGLTMLAGLMVVYDSFATPLLGYLFVVYVTVVAPILLAITGIRFYRSGMERGGPAAWLGVFTIAAILATWIADVVDF